MIIFYIFFIKIILKVYMNNITIFCVFEPIYDFEGYITYDLLACCTSMEQCEEIMLERLPMIKRKYDNLFAYTLPNDCSSVGKRPISPYESHVSDKSIFIGFLIEEMELNKLTVY